MIHSWAEVQRKNLTEFVIGILRPPPLQIYLLDPTNLSIILMAQSSFVKIQCTNKTF